MVYSIRCASAPREIGIYIGMKIKHWAMNDNTRDILSLLCDLSIDILDIYDWIVANLADIVSFCDLICYIDRYSQIFTLLGKCEAEFLAYSCSEEYSNIIVWIYRVVHPTYARISSKICIGRKNIIYKSYIV